VVSWYGTFHHLANDLYYRTPVYILTVNINGVHCPIVYIDPVINNNNLGDLYDVLYYICLSNHTKVADCC
jgi:hypothetical protein